MGKLCKPELCTGCGACATVCPTACIQMVPDAEGFLYPDINMHKCIGCNRCQGICPILIAKPSENSNTIAYAAINIDEQVRFNSTSGGIFTLLSQWVLERNGIIFGAVYDEKFNVIHCLVECSEDLYRLRGAKYAQSNLGNTYLQVQSNLKEGRYVLFSGTPCQVGGLIAFLGKSYERLFLIDLICHGVPSPKVWQHYITYRSEQDAEGQKPTHINLRSKESGWPGYSICFDYPEKRCYTATNSQDPYLRGFVNNLYLRPSCYECHFKGNTRQSDFTLGDYWGVWSQMPTYHDGKGTSVVLLHTQKAKSLWNEITAKMCCTEVDVSLALADNPSALVSSDKSEARNSFFDRYEKEDFQSLIQELCPKLQPPAKRSLIRRVVNKLVRMIRRD